MTHVHIGSHETTLDALSLPIGATQIAERCFRGDRPTGAEIEHAIDLVEDALMRLAPQPGAMLVTDDPALVDLAGGSGAALTREAVEAMFQRLASAALGDPGAARGLPEGREAAARLLILREVMHHGGFEALATPAQPAR